MSATIGGREQNLMATKPGVNTMFLIFSTRDYDRIWELPLFRYFQPELERALASVIGRDAFSHIVRLQMAQMTAGAHIKPHRDSGPWARECALLPLTVHRTSTCPDLALKRACGAARTESTWSSRHIQASPSSPAPSASPPRQRVPT